MSKPLTRNARPCVFVLEPIGVNGALEASGIVYYFCSTACRDKFPAAACGDYALGESCDWDGETVCDECEKPLFLAEVSHAS